MNCNMDCCALPRAFTETGLNDLSPEEVAFMTYWAVHCARCGRGMEWNGFFNDMAVCLKCHNEMVMEGSSHRFAANTCLAHFQDEPCGTCAGYISAGL